MTKFHILLADDHAVVREGLKTLINAQPDMDVIGEAADGQTAVQRAQQLRPDIVMLDISMPGWNGIKALIELNRLMPLVKVLILSVHADPVYLRQVLTAGAAGYVLKHAVAEALIHAIRVVAVGGVYLDPALTDQVIARYVRVAQAPTLLIGTELSERETQVIHSVAQGFTNKEIAAQINLSVKTVETYRARAMEKLGMTNRAALVRYALEAGWLHAS